MPKTGRPPVDLRAEVRIDDEIIDASIVHNRTMIADIMWSTLADVWPRVVAGARLSIIVQLDDENDA